MKWLEIFRRKPKTPAEQKQVVIIGSVHDVGDVTWIHDGDFIGYDSDVSSPDKSRIRIADPTCTVTVRDFLGGQAIVRLDKKPESRALVQSGTIFKIDISEIKAWPKIIQERQKWEARKPGFVDRFCGPDIEPNRTDGKAASVQGVVIGETYEVGKSFSFRDEHFIGFASNARFKFKENPRFKNHVSENSLITVLDAVEGWAIVRLDNEDWSSITQAGLGAVFRMKISEIKRWPKILHETKTAEEESQQMAARYCH